MKHKLKTNSGKSLKVDAPAKAWQARIADATDELAVHYVESLSFDRRLARHDINGSIAHAQMLAKVGLITPTECAAIERGLLEILAEIEAGGFVFNLEQEDIHMAVESALIARIGEPGKKLHTARSRNDQVALDFRLWCRETIDSLGGQITVLQRAFVHLAQSQGASPMPAFTHLQHAQPVLIGHELLAYVEMLERDKQRLGDCRQRVNICPLGSGAVAGSTLPIDRWMVAKSLGFAGVSDNSMDAISDRDFAAELAFDLTLIAVHLSRWAEQWILYSSTEFDFIKIADKYTTGSSMMPQKRNPDMLELMRGKAGGVLGNLVAILTMLKGQPLAYNRDMQEDKRWLFAAADTVEASLAIAAGIVGSTNFKLQSLQARLAEGFMDATALAEYLVGRGVPFRQAHQVVGRLVAQCETRGITELSQLELSDFKAACDAIEKDVYGILGSNSVVKRYISHGAGGIKQLKTQLAKWQRLLR